MRAWIRSSLFARALALSVALAPASCLALEELILLPNGQQQVLGFGRPVAANSRNYANVVAQRMTSLLKQDERSRLVYLTSIISEMRKICGLSKQQQRKLEVAAKGAVHYTLDKWRAQLPQLSGMTVQQAQVAYANYSTTRSDRHAAVRHPIWTKTLDRVLTPEQKETYETAFQNRADAKREALQRNLLNKFATRAPQTPDNRAMLEETMRQVFAQHQKQIGNKQFLDLSDAQAVSLLTAYSSTKLSEELSKEEMGVWRSFLAQSLMLQQRVFRGGFAPVMRFQPAVVNGRVVRPGQPVQVPAPIPGRMVLPAQALPGIPKLAVPRVEAAPIEANRIRAIRGVLPQALPRVEAPKEDAPRPGHVPRQSGGGRLPSIALALTARFLMSKLAKMLTVGLVATTCGVCSSTWAQGPARIRYGSKVPADVKNIYDRGLTYLTKTQLENGSWGANTGRGTGENGVTGMCLMVFLSVGEDPNFGRYSTNVRKAVKSLIAAQDANTGYLGSSMYHHGFATLGLAEAYGAVDETLLWDGSEPQSSRRTIGQALELAVRCAITGQKSNPHGAWRYSPQDRNADTSVSGAVLMGLLAARNAGIEVPDASVEKALDYYKKNTATGIGSVSYSNGRALGASMNRSSIATLVYSIGKKKDWDEYKATLKHITSRLDHQESSYPFYFRYYMAQALFQGDFESWSKWNNETIRYLKTQQADDGSFNGSRGQNYSTAMSLLALALNYRLLPIYER